MTPALYLIVEPIGIIASDLAFSLQDYDDAGTVVVANTQQEALDVLTDKASVRIAFVNADPAEFNDTKLGCALAAQGTVCVFMGDAAERMKKAMIVLDRPFSPATIAALLERLTTKGLA